MKASFPYPSQPSLSSQSKFEALETEVKEINSNKETLKRNLLDLIELQHILQGTQVFFQEASNVGRRVNGAHVMYVLTGGDTS